MKIIIFLFFISHSYISLSLSPPSPFQTEEKVTIPVLLEQDDLNSETSIEKDVTPTFEAFYEKLISKNIQDESRPLFFAEKLDSLTRENHEKALEYKKLFSKISLFKKFENSLSPFDAVKNLINLIALLENLKHNFNELEESSHTLKVTLTNLLHLIFKEIQPLYNDYIVTKQYLKERYDPERKMLFWEVQTALTKFLPPIDKGLCEILLIPINRSPLSTEKLTQKTEKICFKRIRSLSSTERHKLEATLKDTRDKKAAITLKINELSSIENNKNNPIEPNKEEGKTQLKELGEKLSETTNTITSLKRKLKAQKTEEIYATLSLSSQKISYLTQADGDCSIHALFSCRSQTNDLFLKKYMAPPELVSITRTKLKDFFRSIQSLKNLKKWKEQKPLHYNYVMKVMDNIFQENIQKNPLNKLRSKYGSLSENMTNYGSISLLHIEDQKTSTLDKQEEFILTFLKSCNPWFFDYFSSIISRSSYHLTLDDLWLLSVLEKKHIVLETNYYGTYEYYSSKPLSHQPSYIQLHGSSQHFEVIPTKHEQKIILLAVPSEINREILSKWLKYLLYPYKKRIELSSKQGFQIKISNINQFKRILLFFNKVGFELINTFSEELIVNIDNINDLYLLLNAKNSLFSLRKKTGFDVKSLPSAEALFKSIGESFVRSNLYTQTMFVNIENPLETFLALNPSPLDTNLLLPKPTSSKSGSLLCVSRRKATSS
ncbi:hypothetical protein AB834_06400 [PVC group bacterium (ex Bugula neritina AB1)]|nr:hypothetical protein AB834_06400 [PVC group bacterium (ex Bugula neritina AB1)]